MHKNIHHTKKYKQCKPPSPWSRRSSLVWTTVMPCFTALATLCSGAYSLSRMQLLISRQDRAATLPHFAGFEATSLFASAMSSWVQARRPGVQVAAGPNPAVSGGGMPAHHQLPWALSSSFCQRQRLYRPEHQNSIGRHKFLCRLTTSLEQSIPSSLRQLDIDLVWFKNDCWRHFWLPEIVAHWWLFVFDVPCINSFTYLRSYLLIYLLSCATIPARLLSLLARPMAST